MTTMVTYMHGDAVTNEVIAGAGRMDVHTDEHWVIVTGTDVQLVIPASRLVAIPVLSEVAEDS